MSYVCKKCGAMKCDCAKKEREAELAKRPHKFCGCGRSINAELAKARRAAFEEAAKLAESEDEKWGGPPAAGHLIAVAIRALAEKEQR